MSVITKKNPLVSVVMATYNMGQHIGEAVDSILGQSYGNIELIVVDDGSTDGTTEVLDRYRNDKRLRVQRQSNAGQTVAKNLGVSMSLGELIAFCDADDAWISDKLSLQVPLFERNPRVGVVYSGVQNMASEEPCSPSPGVKIPVHRGKVTDALYLLNFVPFGTAVVRSACLERVGAFDERYRMGIDWELWLRISLYYEFDFVDQVTYRYRVWEGQMSNNWRGRYDNALRIMRDFVDRHPNAVSRRTLREAISLTYASRGRARSYVAGEHLAALGDACRSIASDVTYPPGWHLFARVLLNVVGERQP